MLPEQLKKILQLIRKTHDRVIVLDAAQPEEAFVLMDFENYSALASEKPVSPAPVMNAPEQPLKSIPTEKKEVTPDLTEEDLTDKINREISIWKNGEGSAFLAEENKPRPGWQIPPQVKKKAQEVKE